MTIWQSVQTTGIAADGAGNVYVAVESGVQKFDATGTLLTTWGSNGSDPGQFMGTDGVAVDASGNVFVGDPGNGRIQKFDGSGTFLTAWSTSPMDVTVGDGGKVYALDVACNPDARACSFAIDAFDGNGSPLGSFVAETRSLFPMPSDINAFAVDGGGNVYATTGYAGITKFDRTGVPLATWASPGSGQFLSGIAVDAAGNVWVADTVGNRIDEFDSTGQLLTSWGIPTGQRTYNGTGGRLHIAAGGGAIYVADTGRIWKFACP